MNRELRRLCDQVRQLAEDIRKDLSRRKPDSPAKIVALYMFAKAYKSFQASLLLFRQGYWQDSAAVARTVLELSFQAKWLEEDPELASKLFLRGEERDRIKLLKNLAITGDDEIRIEADQLFNQLRSTTDIDLSWRNWWADESNLEKLANQVGFERVYGLQYRHLSWFVHSSPITIRYYLHENERGDDLLMDCKPVAPSPEHEEFAETFFSSAPGALMDVLAVVGTIYELGRQRDFDRISLTLKNYVEAAEERKPRRSR